MMLDHKILTAALSGILAFSLCSCSSTPESSSSTPPTTEPPAAAAASQVPEEPVISESPEKAVFSIGDTVPLKDWSITVTDFRFDETIKENDYLGFTADEGNQFGIVSVTVTNNGKESDVFLPTIYMFDDVKAKILYNTDYEYSATNMMGSGDDIHDKSLNPLVSASGIIVFTIPEAVVSSEESLILSLSCGNEIVDVTLR